MWGIEPVGSGRSFPTTATPPSSSTARRGHSDNGGSAISHSSAPATRHCESQPSSSSRLPSSHASLSSIVPSPHNAGADALDSEASTSEEPASIAVVAPLSFEPSAASSMLTVGPQPPRASCRPRRDDPYPRRAYRIASAAIRVGSSLAGRLFPLRRHVTVDAMETLDAFERAVLRRSLRAGMVWFMFGVGGVLAGVIGVALLQRLGLALHPLVVLLLVAWFVVSVTAVRNGWQSITKARRALADPSTLSSTEDDVDASAEP
jgi:hypothetical protein